MCRRRWPTLSPRGDRRLRRPALCRSRASTSSRPFVGGEIADGRPRGACARRPMPASATRRSRRCVQIGAGPLRARAVPRADARLQGRRDAAAGAADGPCPRRARRARHDRRRDLRRHRRRGDRSLPRPRQRRPLHPLPGGPRLADPAAADDDDAAAANVHALAIEGHLRRLPGDREGAVQQRALPRAGLRSPASTRSTGRGSSRRSSTTSPPPSRSARRSGRSPSPCRPAISATSSPAMPPSAWACRSRGWSSPPTSTTSSPARSTTGRYEIRGVDADHLAVDGHPGLLEFRAAAVRGLWPRRRRGPAPDGGPRQVAAPSPSTPAPLAAIRADFAAGPCRRGGDRRDDRARPARATGFLPDPHTAVGLAVGRALPASRARRWSRSRPRIRPSSPPRSRRRPGSAPTCPTASPTS